MKIILNLFLNFCFPSYNISEYVRVEKAVISTTSLLD